MALSAGTVQVESASGRTREHIAEEACRAKHLAKKIPGCAWTQIDGSTVTTEEILHRQAPPEWREAAA